MKQKLARITLGVILAFLVDGCLKLGKDVSPVLKAQIHFVDSLGMANRTLASLYRNLRIRVEEDCPTFDDTSVLCTRTLDQSEQMMKMLDKVRAMLDEAREVYQQGVGGGEPDSLLAIAVRALLDVSRLADTLRIGAGEALPEGS